MMTRQGSRVQSERRRCEHGRTIDRGLCPEQLLAYTRHVMELPLITSERTKAVTRDIYCSYNVQHAG